MSVSNALQLMLLFGTLTVNLTALVIGLIENH